MAIAEHITEHVAGIKDEGYTIIEKVLSDEEIRLLRLALSPHLQGRLTGRNNFEGFKSERVYALLAKDPQLALVIEHPVVLSILDELLETDYLLSANLAINTHPGALLGYSVRAPGFMGYVDGVHPRRLIDSHYQGRKARSQS